MAIDLSKFLLRFTEEANEHIRSINQGLLKLEINPEDFETLGSVFRSVHTIKGSSRMMKLTHVAEAAHELEEVLDNLREKKAAPSRETIDTLFRGIDAIGEMIGRIPLERKPAPGNEPGCDRPEKAEGRRTASAGASSPPGPPSAEGTDGHGHGEGGTGVASGPVTDDTAPRRGPPSKPAGPGQDETIRVNAEKLDGLIKLAGEMTSGENRSRQVLSKIKELARTARRAVDLAEASEADGFRYRKEEVLQTLRSLQVGLRGLSQFVAEEANRQEARRHDLRETALSMRMLPLSTLFDTFPRMARDLANALGKQVSFVVCGGETELDKKMIEKIGDPIIHMIRNAIDHGIERPEERRKAGKPEAGAIKLSARYEGERVVIELTDDGAGIPVRGVKARALQRRILDQDTLDHLPESEVVNLIFQPGLSTSEIITDISGRGVGMDVVRKNIVEGLKGSIQIESREGEGTTFSIRLLLTLAVMPVLLVESSDMTFAVPTYSVNEIVRAQQDGVIDVVDRKALRLREQIIPLVSLSRILDLPSKANEAGSPVVLVVSMGGDRLGLAVDSLLDAQDMVIKPLPPHMQNVRFVSGLTLSDRNEIINVLNVPEAIVAARDLKQESHKAGPAARPQRAISILVVDDSINTREIEKSILEAYGYSVTLAGDGLEALEKARDARHDVIVTDVEMPRLDGFSLTEQLRRDEHYRDTPIILVTSRDKEEDKKRGIRVGANAYIVKGAFDQSSLIETIRNLVGTERQPASG